ncbi:MAG: metallophosphoesterase [Thermoguttaceae bacterium]|nr:metallophosphoesterase [Thermoguttaceae bacterium]
MSEKSLSRLTRRSFLGGAAAATGLLCLPSRLLAKYEAAADAAENDVVLRFAAMSDIHFKKDPKVREVARFKRALEFMYDYSAKQKYPTFDLLLVAGDISDHGIIEEIGTFKKCLDEGLKPETKLSICMGNHEFWGGSKPLWEKTFGVSANNVCEAKGFQFIALSPEKGTMANGDYLYALDWFEKALADAEAADPEKPIFVHHHYPVSPTVYGGRGHDNWGVKDTYEALNKRPRVVHFSGHSHYPINDPRSAWQGRFSAFNTGTLSYLCMGHEGLGLERYPAGKEEVAQFYIVEVRRDNSVVLKPYDLAAERFYDASYIVAKPGAVESYVYTEERYKTSAKPVWKDGTQVVCKETLPNGAVFEFPQAACDDVVHSYRVEIEKRGKDGAFEPFGTQCFWSYFFFSNVPETLKIELTDLAAESSYRARIFAQNPFLRSSDKSLEIEFSTPVDPFDTVDKNAPKPDANMLAVSFADGKVVNAPTNALETQKPVETFGAPQVVAEESLKGTQAAAFDGSDDAFKIKFDRRDYAKLTNASLGVRFKFDEFTPNNGVIFSNTEGRGIGFNVDSKERKLALWASVDGQYRILRAPVETGKYVDAFATYDGASLVLYVDGKEAARLDVKGRLTHPQAEKAQAFCVGADIGPDGKPNTFFKGSVAWARLYSWALTAEQVANLSQK